MLCVIFFSATVWWQGTNGLQAFTSETARRIDVLASAKELSDVSFDNQYYETVRFSRYKGKIVLLDFIYTTCPDICHALGFSFKSIKTKLKNLGLDEQVQIVNISFDIERDTPEKLAAYVKRYSKDRASWDGLRLREAEKLKQLLMDFGVVVIPNERGGFDHNAAIHILDQRGSLIGIYDYQAEEKIIEHVRQQVAKVVL